MAEDNRLIPKFSETGYTASGVHLPVAAKTTCPRHGGRSSLRADDFFQQAPSYLTLERVKAVEFPFHHKAHVHSEQMRITKIII